MVIHLPVIYQEFKNIFIMNPQVSAQVHLPYIHTYSTYCIHKYIHTYIYTF